MSWICPECQKSNLVELTKCDCGFISKKTEGLERISEGLVQKHTKPCPHCIKEMPIEDKFCSFCGKSSDILIEEEKRKVKLAANWILAISILFIIFGTIFGFNQKSDANEAKKNLAKFEESDILNSPINGKYYTVGELKKKIDQEILLVFLTNYFLAIVMFILYLWARRSPFPAMVTALCMYLAVIVLNGIIDPLTLIQGIIIKIIFISVLVAGIKSSLETRNIQRI